MYFLRQALLVTFGVLTLLASPGARSADNPAADKAFRAGTAEWMAAYNAGDVDRIVALYTETAVMMPPDAPAVTGPAAMRAFLAENIATSKAAGITLASGASATATGASGDLGWHSGTFALVDATGNAVGTGKYFELWQNTKGKWLIVRDIWNNDAPLAAAPAASAK